MSGINIPVFVLLFLADAVFAYLYIRYGFDEIDKKAFFYKMGGAAVFVINGLFAYSAAGKTLFAFNILLALIAGAVGDAFLAMDPFIKKEHFDRDIVICTVVGGAFFFLGHVMYIVAFARELKAEKVFNLALFLICIAVMLGIAIAIKTTLKVKLGKFALPVLAYALVLCSMCALGITLAAGTAADSLLLKAIMVIAPFLFVVSDATIVLRMFDKERFEIMPIRALCLGTYFAAQMLFGLLAVLMSL